MSRDSSRPRAAYLLWGDDGFLLREAAQGIVGDARTTEIDAREMAGGEISDLSTPSLFGDRRALVVTNARHLSERATREITGYLAAPAPDAVLVVTYEVGERAKPPAGFLKLFKEAAEVRELKLARKDLTGWVVERARAKGVRVSGDAVAEAVGILGESPATLDSALDQLASAFPGEVVGAEQVRAQFRGLGEQRVWDLCDRMFARDLSASIHSLRSLLGSRDDPLAILGGIASRLRDLLRVKSVPERTPASEVARAAGLRYEWQARRYLEQARRFTLPELVEIHAQVAEADRQMKSGAPGELVLPVLVTRVSAGV